MDIDVIINKMNELVNEKKVYSDEISFLLVSNAYLFDDIRKLEEELDLQNNEMLPFFLEFSEEVKTSDYFSLLYLEQKTSFLSKKTEYESFLANLKGTKDICSMSDFKRKRKELYSFKKELTSAEHSLFNAEVDAKKPFGNDFYTFFERYIEKLEAIQEIRWLEIHKNDNWTCNSCRKEVLSCGKRFKDPFQEIPNYICHKCHKERLVNFNDFDSHPDFACENGCCICCGCQCDR